MAEPQKQDRLAEQLGKDTTIVLAPPGYRDRVQALCVKHLNGAPLRAVVVEEASYMRLHKENVIVVPTTVPSTRDRVIEPGTARERTVTEESFDLKLAGSVAVRDHFDQGAAGGVGDVRQATFFAELSKLGLPGINIKRPNGETPNSLIAVGLA